MGLIHSDTAAALSAAAAVMVHHTKENTIKNR